MPGKIAKGHKSVKHDIIDKSNSRMILTVGIATFIFVFSIFAGKALISQSLYQNRVITEKEKALAQLNTNKKTLEELKSSFNSFQAETTNILGGKSTGSGPLDGSNAKIILDSLPGKYDYPGLSSSFEKILKEGSYDIGSIGGTEDASLASSNLPSGKAMPIEIPYSFSVSSDVEGITNLLRTLERSIRPMYVDTLQVQVGGNILQTRVSLHTFFTQPKAFDIGTKEVK
jgi:hypothetical protein